MNEHISGILNSPNRDKVLIGVGSALIGSGLGYFLGFRRGRTRTEDEIDRIDAAVRQVTAEYRESELPDDVVIGGVIDAETYAAMDSGEKFVRNLTQKDEVEILDISPAEEDEPSIVTNNIFAGSDDDWDHDEETKNRSEENPYILHKDEFYDDEKDYTQLTLTYYAGDNMMVDDQDQLIFNHETVTGPMRFGHGSGDTKVFYVRNDKLKAEYEIVRHEGTYSEEILGHDVEDGARVQDLKHERSLGKFRRD